MMPPLESALVAASDRVAAMSPAERADLGRLVREDLERMRREGLTAAERELVLAGRDRVTGERVS